MDIKSQMQDEPIYSNTTNFSKKYDVPDWYQDKFQRMAEVGALTAACLNSLEQTIVRGITTLDIDAYVRDFAKRNDLGLACEGYKGYPAACCTSVNHQICHAIPSKKILQNGDVVKVDLTYTLNGWHGDSCRSILVGTNPSPKAVKLAWVARQAMWEGIYKAMPGNVIGDISRAIQTYVEGEGLSVVRDFVGHGIGIQFHCPPAIPNYYDERFPDMTRVLYPGDTFTIEPMVNLGKPDYKILKDGWTTVTRDRSWSAQCEHTIGILNNGNIIFTQ